jgi:hypothetical protein
MAANKLSSLAREIIFLSRTLIHAAKSVKIAKQKNVKTAIKGSQKKSMRSIKINALKMQEELNKDKEIKMLLN